MQPLLFLLILAFGCSSYIVGVTHMLQGKYAPSTFSRIIWFFLAINSLAGVIGSGGSKASILLAVIFLAGNGAICILSFWKGSKTFGRLEAICLVLLLLSVIIWIAFDSPLLNLLISLFAHFVGGGPTYKKVLHNPRSESTGFWSLFFIASALSLAANHGSTLSSIIFPLYYTAFDGGIFVLSLRRYFGKYKHVKVDSILPI
jgi:hypothetical protein